MFLIFLIIGINSFTKYGIAWDEPQQRETGLVSFDYVFNNSNQLLTWQDRDYGVGIELPLIVIEKVFKLETFREIFQTRHLATHLLFLIAAFVFYKISYLIYNSRLLAALGFLFLVSHPLIYGHSFFNSKDVTFLSVFILSLFFSTKLFQRKTISNSLLLGICIAWLLNIRLMGIMVPLLVISFLILDGIMYHRIKHHVKLILVIVFSSFLGLIITWPFLWEAPFENFKFAFENMSKFRYDREMLFMGEVIKPTQIPWYYIPVWFFITTPIAYVVFGVFGILFALRNITQNPFNWIENSNHRNVLIGLILCTVPVLAIIILKSVLYDSWRQMFFIYPPFIILILHSISSIKAFSKPIYYGTIGLLFFSISTSLFFIQKNQPLEHTYFNEFISAKGKNFATKNFDNDYWGLSYKNGLEHILKSDSSKNINISVQNMPGYLNEDMLNASQEERVHMKALKEADYYLTDFRFQTFPLDSLAKFKFYTLSVANNSVLQIYKLK